MSKVLIVDDRAVNRELLVALLGYRGHHLLEAADGVEALALVRSEHPDLVICDIVMPTMDGYEFVRQLRAAPDIAGTQVIFYSAYYREQEARNLARACGVSHVLIKPSEPEEILRVVDLALVGESAPISAPVTEEFDREHLRLLTDKLSDKADRLEHANRRLSALTELNLQLASERDPYDLLAKVCAAARDLIGAGYGVLVVNGKHRESTQYSTHSGIDAEQLRDLHRPLLDSGVLGDVFAARKPQRLINPTGDPAALGLPAGYPAAHSALVCPITSLSFAYGCICLVNKLGADGFSEEDERLLTILSAQVGRIYENGSLYTQVERLNRVHAVLSGINATIVRVQSRDELFEEACRIAVEHGRFRLAWIGVVDRDAGRLRPVDWRGVGDDYIQMMPLGLDSAVPSDYGLAGLVVNDRKAHVVDDIATDPRIALADEAAARGLRSLAVFPLITTRDVEGVLALYAGETRFFDEEEMKLLRELAGDIAFALDTIDRKDRLEYLALFDPLTGLSNRTMFHERLTQDVRDAVAARSQLAVVLLDVERFHHVNDTFGRHAGDNLLKQIADRCVGASPNHERLARVAGDHFAVSIPDIKNADAVARRLEHSIGEIFNKSFRVGDTELRLMAKFGIAMFPVDGNDAESLMQNAEAALKRAKTTGDRYLFYAQQMTERVAGHLALENELRHGLERNQFVLHYQPKVEVETRRIVGVEALIRWQSPGRGLVPPLRFISVLEETGMILDVGAWALRQAREDYERWRVGNPSAPRIAVNVSAVQLRHRNFVDTIRDSVISGTQPSAIDIELTESVLMGDMEVNAAKLREIRELGVNVAIDDFGTGYSSLAYLARLPVHALKIDRSFIATMLEKSDRLALVSTIISLAHSLRLKVVAEGVETEEQARMLRLLRCDEMQGYLISRPVPQSELAELLESTPGP